MIDQVQKLRELTAALASGPPSGLGKIIPLSLDCAAYPTLLYWNSEKRSAALCCVAHCCCCCSSSLVDNDLLRSQTSRAMRCMSRRTSQSAKWCMSCRRRLCEGVDICWQFTLLLLAGRRGLLFHPATERRGLFTRVLSVAAVREVCRSVLECPLPSGAFFFADGDECAVRAHPQERTHPLKRTTCHGENTPIGDIWMYFLGTQSDLDGCSRACSISLFFS